MKYTCETPKEYLNVGLCTFTDDCGENEGGYYAQIAIIDERDGEELTDWVDDCVVHKEDLEGLDFNSNEHYTKGREIATNYMLSVKDELIERYYKGQMDIQ